MIDFTEYDLPAIINGERVESAAKWFEENGAFCGAVEIEIPAQQIEIYRVCVKKEMLQEPVLNNARPIPASQMVGRKIGNFAGFYVMDLHLENDDSVCWRGRIPKNMILEMELI